MTINSNLKDRGFKTAVLRRMEGFKVDEEILQAKKLQKKVPIHNLIKASQVFYGNNRRALVEGVKGNEGRQVALDLSKIMSGERGKEAGRPFGIKGPAV